jgi:hypothetical protein
LNRKLSTKCADASGGASKSLGIDPGQRGGGHEVVVILWAGAGVGVGPARAAREGYLAFAVAREYTVNSL